MGSKIMASYVKVEVIHKETISPSCPTPPHLKTTSNLSFFDQLVPPIYIPLLLFYPICNNGDDFEVNDINHRSLVAERSKLLKASLSEVLTLFYPFAGSFQFNDSICCNDQGAVFLEAQVNCHMSKICDKPDLGMLGQLLPNDHTSHLLQVQANFFECGGLVIGVNISHKVADASTLSKFINRWAAIALGSPRTIDVVPLVAFGAASSLFPPLDFLNSPPAPTPTSDMKFDIKERCTTRRFVFDGSKIDALKSKAASASVPNPTRVEVVSALVWKCAKEASRSNLGSVRPSSWCQTVNMRKVLAQTLADKDLLGNVVGLVAAKTEESSSEAHDHDLRSLVTILRKGIEEFKEKYRNGVRGEEFCQFFMENVNLIMKKDDTDSYSSTSWCRFPLYESNFGWGKPSWVFISSVCSKNTIVLLDARDGGGIEASLTFNEEDMTIFESNEELLEYASLNPSDNSSIMIQAFVMTVRLLSIEARVSDIRILDKPDRGILHELLPADKTSTKATTGLLLVQANFFESGGFVIRVTILRKVGDAFAISKFIRSWATTALGLANSTTSDHRGLLPVEFGDTASLFPPLDFQNIPPTC